MVHQILNTTHSSLNASAKLIHITYTEYLLDTWMKPIVLYLNPVLVLFLGLPANLFIVISVFARKIYRKSPMFVFFSFIAMMDCCTTSATWARVTEVYFGSKFFYSHDAACGLRGFIYHSATHCSCWILMSASLFRLYGLRYPLDIIKRDNVKIAFTICFVIIAIGFPAGCIFFWAMELITYPDKVRPNVIIASCYYLSNNLASIYRTIRIFTYSLVPGFILLCIAVCIIVIFRGSYKAHLNMIQKELSDTKQMQPSAVYSAAKQSIIALLPMSLMHIVCTMPLQLSDLIFGKFDTPFSRSMIVLQYFNHSFNLYIQVMVSKFYRDTLVTSLFKQEK